MEHLASSHKKKTRLSAVIGTAKTHRLPSPLCGGLGCWRRAAAAGKRAGNGAPQKPAGCPFVLCWCGAVGACPASSLGRQPDTYCPLLTLPICLPTTLPTPTARYLSTIAPSYRQQSHISETFHCVRTHIFQPSSINTLYPDRGATTSGAALELPVQFGRPVRRPRLNSTWPSTATFHCSAAQPNIGASLLSSNLVGFYDPRWLPVTPRCPWLSRAPLRLCSNTALAMRQAHLVTWKTSMEILMT